MQKVFIRNFKFWIGIKYFFLFLIILFTNAKMTYAQNDKKIIKAIGMPLADHYPGIIAYEKYRNEMKFADYQILLLSGPDMIRAYFNSEPEADIAFNVCPMVMDMYAENPNFKWVSLIHRDGTALCINQLLNSQVHLNKNRENRIPDNKVANAFTYFKDKINEQCICGLPSPMATHSVVLYKYLKDHGKTMSFDYDSDADVIATIVKPPKSPVFLKKNSTRNNPATFEQSLPWPEIAEAGNYGHVAWYSKDVMQHDKGHVECIIIAKNEVIDRKTNALREVIYFIHKAGMDIENARNKGGSEMDIIIKMIQKHIPSHTKQAITETLNPGLNVINYKNLNIDENAKSSLREIMELALEAGFIKNKIDINAMADDNFSTEITIDKQD